MPLTIVLQFFFRIANMIGFTNFYVIGVLFNAFCILLAYTFVYLCCRRLFGVSKGFFALCLLYLCFPLQCYISVFYTDTITLFFAPFCFYLYLRMRDAKTWKGVLLAALIMTVGMAIGTKIKYSVVIAVIAVLVDLLLRLDWKKLLLVGVSFCVLFLAVNAGFNSFMYAHFLDKDTAKDAATPFTSWIMMGLKGDGAHNPDDNYLIWNWETAEEKQAQAASEIKNRLLAFTPSTFVKFYNQKALRSWGAGNLDIADWAGNSPVRETFLAAAIYEKSPTYATMDTISQGYYVALFAMVIVGAILACLKRDYKVFVPYLGIFGLFLFLLLWEAGQRYLVNYFGFYIIAAVFGTTKLAQVIKEKRSAEKEEVVEI